MMDEDTSRESADDLIVGLVGGTIIPPIGIVLGAMMLRRGDQRGLWPLCWGLLLTVFIVGAILASAS